MANCAAPETMITDEKTASHGGNPARTQAVSQAEPGDGEDDEDRVPYPLAK